MNVSAQNVKLEGTNQITPKIVQNTAAADQAAETTTIVATMAALGCITSALGNLFEAKKVKLDLLEKIGGDPRKFQAFFFMIEQYCELSGINSGHKVKLAVTRCEKDALTWWNRFDASHTNAFTTTD